MAIRIDNMSTVDNELAALQNQVQAFSTFISSWKDASTKVAQLWQSEDSQKASELINGINKCYLELNTKCVPLIKNYGSVLLECSEALKRTASNTAN